MGYTHYWDLSKSISKTKFDKIKSDVKDIEIYMSKVGEPLYDGVGVEVGVEYTEDEIVFNGNGNEDEDMETMVIEQNPTDSYNFCKTNRNPYDLAVALTLLSLKYHVRSAKVKSDGYDEIDTWGEVFKVFKELFPDRDVSFSFKKYVSGSKSLDGRLLINKNNFGSYK